MSDNDKDKMVKEDAKKWRFLWISVTLVAVFLIGIWIWSFKYRLVNANWDQSSEKQLMENLNRDWQEAGEMIDKPIKERESAEEEIKNKLIEMASETANTSSTEEDSVSSTDKNNSTTTNQLE